VLKFKRPPLTNHMLSTCSLNIFILTIVDNFLQLHLFLIVKKQIKRFIRAIVLLIASSLSVSFNFQAQFYEEDANISRRIIPPR